MLDYVPPCVKQAVEFRLGGLGVGLVDPENGRVLAGRRESQGSMSVARLRLAAEPEAGPDGGVGLWAFVPNRWRFYRSRSLVHEPGLGSNTSPPVFVAVSACSSSSPTRRHVSMRKAGHVKSNEMHG
jgi:hypothetical protein